MVGRKYKFVISGGINEGGSGHRLKVKIKSHLIWLLVAATFWFAIFDALAETEIFDAQNFPGVWTLTTNADGTITAREKAVHRIGDEAFSRTLSLAQVAAEVAAVNPEAASAADIKKFIANYRPPPIPYTSEAVAEKTGTKKFTCLEFAEDLETHANASGIPAQVIGIKFEGKIIGHAVAGFPTADGGMLYFDSTPAAGQISHAAHEAQVEMGQPYHRAGGGELATVGKLPITEIIPVTKLMAFANNFSAEINHRAAPEKMVWAVQDIQRTQAEAIEYADTHSLRVADDQLVKWMRAAEEATAAQNNHLEKIKFSAQSSSQQAAARALADNEQAAAQNDAYGQLRMGERYLAGDGVKKNLLLAQAYLRQAADQGNPTAAEELKKLTE